MYEMLETSKLQVILFCMNLNEMVWVLYVWYMSVFVYCQKNGGNHVYIFIDIRGYHPMPW